MQLDIREQYNQFPKEFSINQADKNQVNRTMTYDVVNPHLSGANVLDLCCGDGIDSGYFAQQGAKVTGIDASSELIKIAKSEYPHIQFDVGLAEKLPYADNQFDVVYSKYAIMTSADMEPIFTEVTRVLKPGGIFVYLVTHPIRQFMEKKQQNANYFKKEIVDCVILDGTVTVKEPTHKLTEYLNKDFFEKFEMLDYTEAWDPAAEQVNDAVYPGFMIIKARKK